MKTILPGLKTNINTIALGLIQIATVAGVTIDPATFTALLDQWWGVAVGVQGALIASGIWFRSLAD
jgi:hypothetical protein